MKRFKVVSYVAFLSMLVGACEIRPTQSSRGSDNSEEIRQKYNALSTTAIALHGATTTQDSQMIVLDRSIQVYLKQLASQDAIAEITDPGKFSREELAQLERANQEALRAHRDVIERIGQVESSLLNSIKALGTNVGTNVKQGSQASARAQLRSLSRLYSENGQKLMGLRDLVIRTQNEQTEKLWARTQALPPKIQDSVIAGNTYAGRRQGD
jgi:hypothetical protein